MLSKLEPVRLRKKKRKRPSHPQDAAYPDPIFTSTRRQLPTRPTPPHRASPPTLPARLPLPQVPHTSVAPSPRATGPPTVANSLHARGLISPRDPLKPGVPPKGHPVTPAYKVGRPSLQTHGRGSHAATGSSCGPHAPE